VVVFWGKGVNGCEEASLFVPTSRQRGKGEPQKSDRRQNMGRGGEAPRPCFCIAYGDAPHITPRSHCQSAQRMATIDVVAVEFVFFVALRAVEFVFFVYQNSRFFFIYLYRSITQDLWSFLLLSSYHSKNYHSRIVHYRADALFFGKFSCSNRF
jgi:hypothetical protein